jgi:RimJ/RimL family protein N-acetyltransferase
MIETPRCRLLPCEARHLEAFRRGREAFAAAAGVALPLPEGWPEFPEGFTAPPPGPPPWGGWLFVAARARTLLGNGGFKGAPDEGGMVEIGYEVAPAWRGCGFGTEIVRGLVDFALADSAVQLVQAHTLGEASASSRVLEKVGLRCVAEFEDPEVGRVWCWRRQRGDAAARADRG